MTERTKARRSEAAEKAAATRKENEAKGSGGELRKAATEARKAARRRKQREAPERGDRAQISHDRDLSAED